VALPKIQAPIYTVKLPVLDKKVQYRPFTVKEEKLLLMAAESSDAQDVFTAFQQVVNNCIVTEGVDAGKLHIFDLEIMFLLLRVASVGDEATFFIRDEETEKPVEITVNLTEVVNESIRTNKIPSKQIQINETIGLVMKDINLDVFTSVVGDGDTLTADQEFDLIKRLIDQVYDQEDLMKLEDFSDEEVNEFLDSFQASDMEKLYAYLAEMPRVRTTLKYKVEGVERERKLEGITDFFQSA
jgi:hypothetical protein